MKLRLSNIIHEPALWTSLSILLSVSACFLYGQGMKVWGMLSLVAAIWCGRKTIVDIKRIRSNLDYVIAAAMSSDFSYSFPEKRLSHHVMSANHKLNLLVKHLEKLSSQAHESELFLQKVINFADMGIIIADKNHRVIYSNKAALSILGVSVLNDIYFLHDSSEGIDVRETSTVYNGEAITIFTISDITQNLQNVEVESWERLTRVLTHEIMNSLTPVNSIAGELVSSLRNSNLNSEVIDDIRSQIEVIHSSSNSLMEFVKNFRTFTILPEPKPKAFYVKHFVERNITLAKAFPTNREVDFRVLVFPPDLMMYTDINMLGQVVVNLLKNAIEANASVIEIEAGLRQDESVFVSISNNGDKICREIASQIFTPFFTTKSEGSGIGLSLSRRIVSRLGGTLTLSASPSTSFTITI